MVTVHGSTSMWRETIGMLWDRVCSRWLRSWTVVAETDGSMPVVTVVAPTTGPLPAGQESVSCGGGRWSPRFLQ